MELEKEDLRVKRTRKLLCMSLFDLMQTAPFDKLSVNDICEKAMVHRATFYNHFNDKNDLLNFALDDIQEEMFEKSIENEAHQTPKEMYLALISNVIDFINENREKLVLIFNNSSDKMATLVSTTIKRSIRYLLSRNKYKEEYLLPIDFIVNFFTGGIAMIGIDWLQSKNPYSKQEMLSYFDTILNADMFVKK